MYRRAVVNTSRTSVRTFGSDDAGHLILRARFRKVTLDDPGLPPVVGVITSKLFLYKEHRKTEKQNRKLSH
jgi:hypothetical protein